MQQTSMSNGDRVPVIDGYRIIQPIYSGSKTLIYRGIRLADGQSVVLKVLKENFPTLPDLLRLRNHYTIAKNLDLPGVLQPLSLASYGNGFVLVMPDEGACALSDYLAAHPLNLVEVLEIALQLTTILHDLYQNRVIHKDIKPANILIHPETKQVKLIDFSLASLLPRETQEIQNPAVLEGTLAYMAPEQTGRMNRGIDYRSDFYALGVTLFELLTGQLPFQSEEPMELLHCHLTRQAPAAHSLNPAVPPILSAIVEKLMAKNAEDRYQSAVGLKHDVATCLEQMQVTEQSIWFALGQRDVCDRFLIPERLYGREAEVLELLNAFNRVSAGSTELLLVTGFSGIGKTAVVNEVHKPIVRQRGYFIKGKFDQFNRNIPFSAFVQAFRDLMEHLLSESDGQLTGWKQQILAAVGENGQVLIEVIPELAQIIGKQPAAPELSGSAAQNRFNLLFQKFIAVFTTVEHPLVMFLDDLQWADSASLKLMQVLMSQTELGYLLLIGAYRDNEVFPAHPLRLTLDEMSKTQIPIRMLTLAPLNSTHIHHLIADALSCSLLAVLPFSKLVYQKTKGNPFFTTQFLKALHQEGYIAYDFRVGHWQCDLVVVRSLALTDDVVEFMALQLQKLPSETQRILTLAACIGAQFDLATLAIVSEQSSIKAATALWTALQKGLILPTSQVYKFFQGTEPSEPENTVNPTYRFLHDHVQQAAYSLIPETQRAAIHLRIGRLLLNHTSPTDQEEKLFVITSQLNAGVSQIIDPIERNHLAELNLKAGRKAKAATAHSAALAYLTVGYTLLSAQSWQTDYELTLALHQELTEVSYLTSDFEQIQQWAEPALTHAHSLLDQVTIYEIQIQAHSVRNQFKAALQLGLKTLQQLGVNFPETVGQTEVGEALQEMQRLIERHHRPDLLNLPVMTDPTSLAATRLMLSLGAVVYFIAPGMFSLLILRQLQLSIRHGNTVASPYAYAWCGIFSGIESGYQLGQLALDLLQHLDAKINVKSVQAKTYFTFYVFIHHWKAAIVETVTPLREAYQSGLEAGDLEFACYCIIHCLLNAYFVGQELDALEKEILITRAAIAQMHQENAYNSSGVYHQAILNLLGRSNNSCLLIGTAYDETQMIPFLQQNQDITSLQNLYLHKLILTYLFGDYEQAIAVANQAEQYLDSVPGITAIVVQHFYSALSKLAVYHDRDPETQKRLLQQIEQHQTKLQLWATSAPMNYQQKFELVEAERHRVQSDWLSAIDYYDRAIASAKANHFIQDEALANELAAKFYLDWGKEKVAASYMQEAYYGYAKWGTKAKTDDLEQQYPALLTPILQSVAHQASPGTSTLLLNQSLDITSVFRAAQAISEEIVLEHLLTKLMQVILATAGATKGILLLPNNDQMTIVAMIDHDSEQVVLVPFLPMELSQDLPLTIVNSVRHYHEPLILDDPQTNVSFVVDPYWQHHLIRAALCMPLLKQGRLIGILYLENQLTAGAFTRDRMATLTLLCTQAAISLENAQLYQQSQQALQALRSSEARLQSISDNLPGVIFQICIYLAQGSSFTSYISSGCYDLYEVTVEAMLRGQYNLRDFEHPDDQPRITEAIRQSAQMFTPFRQEFRIITPSGKVKWVQVASQPKRQSDELMVWDGILMDISDRKYLEQEQARLLAILEASSDFIGTANPAGQVTWLNTRFRQLYQLTPKTHLADYRIADLHPQWAIDRLQQEAIPQAIEFGRWLGETALLTPDGREIPVSQVVMSHKSANGSLEYLSTIIRDISDRKTAEAQLQQQAHQLAQANQQLENYSQTLEQRVQERTAELQAAQERIIAQEKLASLGTLTAGIAHELRNPLNFVKNYAEGSIELTQDLLDFLQPVLESQLPTISAPIKSLIADLQANATIIRRHSQRAEQIITSMMQHARTESEQASPQPTRLHDLLKEALKLVCQSKRAQDSHFNLTIHTDYAADVDWVDAIPTTLMRAFINLIDNACDAMRFKQHGLPTDPPQTTANYTPTLTISTRQIRERVEIRIRDNGCGISPQIQSRILDPFFTTKPPGAGTGLGLSLTHDIIVKQHQGTLEIASEPEEFTEILITFPAQTPKVCP